MIRFSRLMSGLLALALLLISVQVHAGTGTRRGTAGATELLIPVSARGIALNGAYIAGFNGVEAIYWNPAGLAATQNNAQVMLSHMSYIADMGINYGAAAARFGSVGHFAVSFKSLDFGSEIVETTIENPDGTGRTFSPTYFVAGLTFSRQMTDRIHFGTTGKIVSERVLNAGATGFAMDFGLQYATGLRGFQLGITLRNFGPRMKFSGPELEKRVQLPGTEEGARQENLIVPATNFELPSTFELGFSYAMPAGENNALTLMGMFQNNSFSYDGFNLAAEFEFNKLLFLRGSYSIANREDAEGKGDGFASSNEDYLFGPALGAGINLKLGEDISMIVDYAYRSAEFFDANNVFTFTFGF